MSADAIVLSSDSEVDGEPIVLSSRSSSPLAVEQAPYRASSPELDGLQEATTSVPPSRQPSPSPAPSPSPSPPALAPSLSRRAARKSAQGVRASAQRPTASRVRFTRVKKEEDDDGVSGAAVGTARRSPMGAMPKVEEDQKWLREKRKGRKDELLLNNLPYPFDVSLRLEEIRLTLKNQSSPKLSTSVAFRTLETPARDAVPTQKHTITLDPSMECFNRFPAASSSRLASPNLPETIPSSPFPRIPPFDVFASPLAEQQAPHDIVFLLSLQYLASSPLNDPPPVTYAGHLSLTKGGKLRTSGEGTVKLKLQEPKGLRAGSKPAGPSLKRTSADGQEVPAASGGEVSVSWAVKVHDEPEEWEALEPEIEDGATDGGERQMRVGDEEMREILEAELRKQEREWREEVVERHEFYANLETAYSLTSPPSLDVDPSAPTPSSLIPGLDGPAPPSDPHSPPPRFVPVPSYTHTSFHPDALPFDAGPMITFPQYSRASNDATHWRKVAKVFAEVLSYEMQEEDEPGAMEEEEEYRRRRWVQHEAFTPPDIGRVHRDFLSLRHLLTSLSLTPTRLAALELAARADPAIDFSPDDEGCFAFQHFGTGAQVELARQACGVFESRTGVSAWLANARWAQTGGGPLFSLTRKPGPCEFCGTIFCTLHGDPSDAIHAYNVPTKSNSHPKLAPKRCSFCGHAGCLNVVEPRHNEPLPALDELAARIKAGEVPPLDPCMASRIVGHPVAEDDVFVYPPPPTASSKPAPPIKLNKKLLPGASLGYEPCNCLDGKCDGESCTCSMRETFCDRYCGCPSSCRRRFAGCKDSNCFDCVCKQQNRECDPHICGCTSDTCRNSSIRLGREKLVQVVESKLPGAGYGVILLEHADEDDLIGVYGGEYFGFEAGDLKPGPIWAEGLLPGQKMSYWFKVEGVENGHVVDSQLAGSAMRFINGAEGEQSNVDVKVRYVHGMHQIAVYASHSLKAGTELLMNYGEDYPDEWAGKEAEEAEDGDSSE